MKTMKLALVAISLAMAACATAPVPADRLSRAQETVRLAEELPATKADPKAVHHLQLAKDQLKQAKQLMVAGKNGTAKWVLMRAEADGEAALYLARAHAAKLDAQSTLESIRQAMALMKQEGQGT